MIVDSLKNYFVTTWNASEKPNFLALRSWVATFLLGTPSLEA